jgi:Fe-S-cluster containining protein
MTRAERRRQLREDERALARGLDAERPDGPQIMVLMRLLHARLEEAREARTLAPLGDFIAANMRAAERAAPRRAIACRMGCAHCCHSFVSARAPEVLLAKAAIAARDREAARAAVEAAWDAAQSLGPDRRAGLACPMLRDGRCSIYAARPATCRTAVSSDAAICARTFAPGAAAEDIPTPDFYIVMRRGYSIALAGALKRAGFPASSYDFTAALRAALAKPGAELAWLTGEDVFEGVAIDPGSDPFAHPKNRLVYEAAWAS